MRAVIGRCGYRCDLCMAYKKNGSGMLHQLKVAQGWFTYYDLKVHPAKLSCGGCHESDSRLFCFDERFGRVCDCVVAKNIENCGHCEDYPCPDLKYKMDACEAIRKRYEGRISKAEFMNFIAPYDPRENLEKERGKSV